MSAKPFPSIPEVVFHPIEPPKPYENGEIAYMPCYGYCSYFDGQWHPFTGDLALDKPKSD